MLKMKLMLEKGAQFYGLKEELPPEVERAFLDQVIAFEKQLEKGQTIKVSEKLGNPLHFKPVSEISEEGFKEEWEKLRLFMQRRGVSLDVCSPNISSKELYRFALEELFQQEMEDFQIPGMMCCFIYDEFHPDPQYENERAALDTMKRVLGPEVWECLPHLRRRNLRLNQRFPLQESGFRVFLNRFKDAYDRIDLVELSVTGCDINGDHCRVTGQYNLKAGIQREMLMLDGAWEVELEFNRELGYWYVFNVQVAGINF